MKKREEVVSWDGYFMGKAALASFRSKDPNTQNGACIVDMNSHTPLVSGYNGFPRGCSDDEFPWSSPEKYPYAEHAERNAIFNAAKLGIALDGSVLYFYSERGYYPCADCARAIIQSGIKKVILAFAIQEDTDNWHWSEPLKMLKAVDIPVEIMITAETPKEEVAKIIKDFDLVAKKFEGVSTKLVEASG